MENKACDTKVVPHHRPFVSHLVLRRGLEHFWKNSETIRIRFHIPLGKYLGKPDSMASHVAPKANVPPSRRVGACLPPPPHVGGDRRSQKMMGVPDSDAQWPRGINRLVFFFGWLTLKGIPFQQKTRKGHRWATGRILRHSHVENGEGRLHYATNHTRLLYTSCASTLPPALTWKDAPPPNTYIITLIPTKDTCVGICVFSGEAFLLHIA